MAQGALRKLLSTKNPTSNDMRLVDYKQGEEKFASKREASRKRLDELKKIYDHNGYWSVDEEMEWDHHANIYHGLEKMRKQTETKQQAISKRQKKQILGDEREGIGREAAETYEYGLKTPVE